MTDKQLFDFVKDFRKGVLGRKQPHGHCWMVAAPLSGLLNLYMVENELVEFVVKSKGETWEHYALLLPDGRIIDPTASQFFDNEGKLMPAVYMGSIPDNYQQITQKQ